MQPFSSSISRGDYTIRIFNTNRLLKKRDFPGIIEQEYASRLPSVCRPKQETIRKSETKTLE